MADVSFIVTVVCAASLKVCPIPSGIHDHFPASDKANCEHRIKEVIEGFGHKTKDFVISCEEKR